MEWYTAPKQIPPGDTPHPPEDPRFCILFIYISRFSRWNFFKTALLLHAPGEWCIYIHTSSTKKHLCRKTFRAKEFCLSFWTIYGQGGQKQTIFINTLISAPNWKVSIYTHFKHKHTLCTMPLYSHRQAQCFPSREGSTFPFVLYFPPAPEDGSVG